MAWKSLIHLIKSGHKIPFDVNSMRVVYIDTDLDILAKATEELERQFEQIEKEGVIVDTPISVAIDLQILRTSDNPEKRQIGEILTHLDQINSRLSGIERNIESHSNPTNISDIRSGFYTIDGEGWCPKCGQVVYIGEDDEYLVCHKCHTNLVDFKPRNIGTARNRK